MLALLAGGPASAQAAESWAPAGSMAGPRTLHTATLLGGGKVLVTGGFGTMGVTATAERYDPTSNTWSSAGSMASTRWYHAATLLPNGHVLVTGGLPAAGSPVSTNQQYDPATNAWSGASALMTARYEHTATLMGNGKVLIAGGYDGLLALSSAELYDPATNTASPAAPMALPRAFATATALPNGKVLVAGGFGLAFVDQTSSELYDPATDTWAPAGSMSRPRSKHTATLLANGKVLVAGGDDGSGAATPTATADLYDPATNTWSPAASMPAGRFMHAATRLPGGRAMVTGGYVAGTGISPSAQVYDPATNDWSAAPNMGSTRQEHTATQLLDGRVLVVGGTAFGAGAIGTAEQYGPPPTITIASPVDGGIYGQKQKVVADYLCTSPVLVTSCAGTVASGTRFDTKVLGARAFTVSTSDATGRSASKTVHYKVIAVPLLSCQKRDMALVDVRPSGKRVRVSGVTQPSFAGQSATIALGSKNVGTATVGRLGTFATTVPMPALKKRAGARYRASISGHRSVALKLVRRSYFTRVRLSAGKLKLAGGVTGPFKIGAKVTVQSLRLCTKAKKLGTAKLTRKGTWKLTVTAPGKADTLLYRARITLGRATTFTLPTPAT